MKLTFSNETRIDIYKKFNGRCGICGTTSCLECHHILANTKTNTRIYGERIQSADNGFLICHEHHEKVAIFEVIKQRRQELKNKWNAIDREKSKVLLSRDKERSGIIC
jgi:hypothetical protein